MLEALEQLKQKFNRYFFLASSNRSMNTFSLLGKFFKSDNREALSEILPQRIYLGNLPKRHSFSANRELAQLPESALVVSCIDISELMESDLLL